MPGPVITFDYVAVEIAKLSELYNIRQVAYDLWRINDLMRELEVQRFFTLRYLLGVQRFFTLRWETRC